MNPRPPDASRETPLPDLTRLTTRPGVYLFRDSVGEILYVGKARSLRPRVRSYFRGRPSSIRVGELARRTAEVETVVVQSEAEALLLEANLIKEHRPRFNIQLRDDKRYPYIKVTMQEPFPRVIITRRVRDDGARYFGPFTNVGPLRQALEVMKRLYTVRSCRYNLPKDAPPRPCLDYHIGRCQAPCVGLQSQSDYREMMEEILRILGGDTEDLRKKAEVRMETAAQVLDFEEAAKQRDVVRGLDVLAREQRVQTVGGGDRDVVGMARDGELGVVTVLRIRKGVLLGREARHFQGLSDEAEGTVLRAFLSGFYLGRGIVGFGELPTEILLPGHVEDEDALAELLGERAGRKVLLSVPQRGERQRLLELASENARHLLEERVPVTSPPGDRGERALYELQDRLGLKMVPRLMACFDISHHQGDETVASAAVFRNGEPWSAAYRRMRIKGTWGNDDVRSMGEVVERYLVRRLKEDEPLPQLLVIDGGVGQLGAALQAVERAGAPEVAVVALAKREEEVHLPGGGPPLRLDRRDRSLQLLQRIRDEAHRFAIAYNRKLRGKKVVTSQLAEIPGVGPSRQKALLQRFGSVRGLREASAQEVARVPGISEVLASRILTYLGR